MGTPDFAVPTLEALVASPRHRLAAVVCQPDQPRGRGHRLAAPPVKEAALRHGLPVLQPTRLRSKDGARQRAIADELRAFAPDAIVVVAYGRILPPELLSLPPHGCLNVHASLLPKYRGAAPIQWAIARGEHETGVSIMQMDEGLDTGPVLATERLELLGDDDATSVSHALSVIGADALLRVLDAVDAGAPPRPVPQSELGGEPSLAPILRREDGLLDWTASTEAILCRIHGFRPWPGTYTRRTGDEAPFHIVRAEPWNDGGAAATAAAEDDAPAAAEEGTAPGTVVRLVKERGFTVRTGSGELLVLEVKPPNKAAMPADAAANGRLVRLGERFH